MFTNVGQLKLQINWVSNTKGLWGVLREYKAGLEMKKKKANWSDVFYFLKWVV